MIAWFNGNLLPLNGISIAATDRGFLLGDGFFETLAAEKGKVSLFPEHMARLRDTSDFLGLPVPYSDDDILKAIDDVLTGCQLKDKRAALRLSVSRGSGPRGLVPPLDINPQILISASEIPTLFPSAHLVTVHIRRNELSPTSRIKSLCYLDNILAQQEARDKGGDEALMLNTQGHIAEGSISNIFFIRENCLLTPPISDGCLPGVMRQLVLALASDLELSTQEISLNPDILHNCDEAFLTNSLIRVRPVHQIDARALPSQHWTDKLASAVLKTCLD